MSSLALELLNPTPVELLLLTIVLFLEEAIGYFK